jgi:CRISPR-associated protein Cas8a1/Csx13
MRNRFRGERERLRLAFAGAKTPDQVRAALADLWSRGGTNRELQASWEQVLPLLRPERWQVARDLALVALASYQGASKDEEAEDAEDEEPNNTDGGGR